jgi:hypothetical protein
MRKIVDGVAYNTSTSTRLAKWGAIDDVDKLGRDYEETHTLYQTQGGAFFVDIEVVTQIPDPRDDREPPRERVTREFVPMTLTKAKAWLVEGNVEVFDDSFAKDIPEAEGETEGGSTIYVRVPATLKRRIDVAASAAGQSASVWGLKCFELFLSFGEGGAQGDESLKSMWLRSRDRDHLDALRKTSEELISMAQRK